MDRTFPRSLVRLNITQFLGAFNDNLLKLLIIFHLIWLSVVKKKNIPRPSFEGLVFSMSPRTQVETGSCDDV